MRVEQPPCAGWHEEGEEECDGTDTSPPCLYREKCLLLKSLASAPSFPAIRVAKEAYPDAKLTEIIRERNEKEDRAIRSRARKKAREAKAKIDVAVAVPAYEFYTTAEQRKLNCAKPDKFGIKVPKEALKKRRKIVTPDFERMSKSLPLLNEFCRRFAVLLGRGFRYDGDPKVFTGDLLLRFYRNQENRCRLLEALYQKNTNHRLLLQIKPKQRSASLDVSLNTPFFLECLSLNPPNTATYTTFYLSTDRRFVKVSGVTIDNLNPVVKWIAQCYNKGLILRKLTRKELKEFK